MFAVIFEVHPAADQWNSYIGVAKMLRPELQAVEGFVDNVRYRSLSRDGWILSLSGWRDEKALVRWRTKAQHHGAQEVGRGEILQDYHLRVGQITADSHVPAGHRLREQRLDETVVGEGTTIVLLDGKRTSEWVAENGADGVAQWLGIDPELPGLVSWDAFDAVLTPGDVIALSTWRHQHSAQAFADDVILAEGVRRRIVRVVRDYGMYDRREAPQYYPEVPDRR
ncbi:antibiotic biosynthesis monooxygenase family protein [Caenimonas soli]|uniref:antibiotic biosynthesis monooxygenase family protein n=1 Tax=Caenimonas soli TaxID=2735555 RepID=UPI001556A34E|nr:antibiotic biosynthesis monooxygenase [Caenimonas soli]NPC59152.1 antibiotic biosynthesis monooxygenase [Caenimonas soli]